MVMRDKLINISIGLITVIVMFVTAFIMLLFAPLLQQAPFLSDNAQVLLELGFPIIIVIIPLFTMIGLIIFSAFVIVKIEDKAK